MGPLYVARKSIIGECCLIFILCIVFCWLIFPIFIAIYCAIEASAFRVEFYDRRVETHSGLFITKNEQTMLTNIIGVTIYQSLMGKMLNYGDVHVNVIGALDIKMKAIKDPYALKNYLDLVISKQSPSNIHHIITN